MKKSAISLYFVSNAALLTTLIFPHPALSDPTPPVPLQSTPIPHPVVAPWQLRVTAETLGAGSAGESVNVANLVAALNSAYSTQTALVPNKPDKAPVHVYAVRSKLMLCGDEETVLRMKRDLVSLDALGPQVQLDVWAVQMAGKGDELDAQIKQTNRKLTDARSLMLEINRNIEKAIHARIYDSASLQSNLSDDGRALLPLLRNVGFDTDPNRKLSLSEALIFLGLIDREARKRIFDTIDEKVQVLLAKVTQPTTANGGAHGEQYLFTAAQPVQVRPIFRRLRGFYFSDPGTTTGGPHAKGHQDFFETLAQFQNIDLLWKKAEQELANAKNRPDLDAQTKAEQRKKYVWLLPERLARLTAHQDALNSRIAEAISADLSEMVLEPLVANLLNSPDPGAARHAKGTSLLGKTRLVVTSGLQSKLAPTLTSQVETTQAKPIDMTEVKTLFGASGPRSIFDNFSSPQAALLQLLLTPTPQTFTTVAPGISLDVRPTVMPDSLSARLQIDARFGVATVLPKKADGSDNPQSLPFDAVQSHYVTTDAVVDGLDLFGISSMTIETRAPNTPFVVPILGRVPLLGPMFQFPRKDVKNRHNSVILVNTLILPRALDLANFYGTQGANQTEISQDVTKRWLSPESRK